MSYHYMIIGWVGNLGNHLLQLSHAIYLAERYGGLCTFAQEPFLENKQFDFLKTKKVEKIIDENIFEVSPKRYSPFGEDYSLDLHLERPRILKNYILPIFKPYQKINLDYDMVINLRGGDVFSNDYTYPQYVQAPLSYFLKVLEKEKPNKVLIVAQDKLNPVIKELMKTDYCIDVHTDNDVNTDCNEVLNAKTLVVGGVSTFTLMLSQMSPNIEKIYYPDFEDGWNLSEEQSWMKDDWYFFGNLFGKMKCEVIPIKLKDYIKIGEWDKYTYEEKTMLMLKDYSINT